MAGCYNPKQVLEMSGKRYLTGPVVFVRFNMEGEYVSLTMGDLHCIQEYLEQLILPFHHSNNPPYYRPSMFWQHLLPISRRAHRAAP